MGQMPGMLPMGTDAGGEPPPIPPRESGGNAYPFPSPQVASIVKPRPRWQALRTISGNFKVLVCLPEDVRRFCSYLPALREEKHYGPQQH
jgi:hypothetical protein